MEILSIRYRKTVIKKMFSTSGNPCFQNSNMQNCIEKCKLKKSIAKSKLFPSFYLARPFNTVKENLSIKFNMKTKSNFAGFMSECHKECKLFTECYKEHFEINFEQLRYTFLDDSIHYFVVRFPSNPTTVYEISLKMC